MTNTVINASEVLAATIASGQSLSPAINAGGLRLFGIVTPAALTGSAFTFQMSHDGGTSWANMYDATGVEVSVNAGTSRYIAVDPSIFAAIGMFKVRSGSAGTPVTQGQDAALQLVLRSV